ncbi:hypothetical protein BV96_02302 [Sphingomonas paucimobilis]|nr:hypothetical protein BV96_02302 [Sphingomonas paucimobilis]
MRPSEWLKFWSKRRPDDVSPRIMLANLPGDDNKRLVALRSAMRAFPGVARIGDGPWGLGRETELPIRLHAIRAIFVTWSEFVFDGVRNDARRKASETLAALLAKLDEGLPDFYNRNIMGSDYAVASWQDAVEAARRGVSLVEAIETLAFQDLPFDHGRSYRDFLDTLSIYGPTGRSDMARWRAAQRAAIGADCAVLQDKEMTPAELALAPLWPDPHSAALETNLTRRLSAKNAGELGGHIETWLRERKDGSLVLNMDPEQARERVVKIANLPLSFWQCRPATDTLYAFDYCLDGDLKNPNWGSETLLRPDWQKMR